MLTVFATAPKPGMSSELELRGRPVQALSDFGCVPRVAVSGWSAVKGACAAPAWLACADPLARLGDLAKASVAATKTRRQDVVRASCKHRSSNTAGGGVRCSANVGSQPPSGCMCLRVLVLLLLLLAYQKGPSHLSGTVA